MRIKKLKKGYEFLSLAKVRIIARLKFDGCIFRTKHDYVMKYELIDDDLLESFKQDLIDVYGLKPTRLLHRSGKTGKLIPLYYLRSKLAYEDLMKYGPYFSNNWAVPVSILNSKDGIKKEFLRCFFDDEGSVVISKKQTKCVIKGYSINKIGLIQLFHMLKSLNINGKLYGGFGLKRNVFALIISDLTAFQQQIGFSCERKRLKLQNFMMKT